MAEHVALVAFVVLLVGGTAVSVPLPAILACGLALFVFHGLAHGIRLRDLARAAAGSARSVGSMLALFVVVGALAASWRAAGTIATIVCWSSALIRPGTAIVAAFLMCCLMSMLLGTAFGTAATMGVICMAIAHAMGANELLVGGAVLSGCYFGDRCSPMSTSAVLVSRLTGTDLFDNVGRMLRTGLVPFALSCVAYAALGTVFGGGTALAGIGSRLAGAYSIGWASALPALVVVVLSLMRMNVLVTMSASLACACATCVLCQGVSPASLPGMLVFGYQASQSAVARIMDGGGVVSMANVMAVIAISSCYAGIFRRTGLIDGAEGAVTRLSRHSTPFFGVLATSVASCMVACNQTLAIMLTRELCGNTEGSEKALALDLENSVVIISPLVPWSISNVAVLTSAGAPALSLAAAAFCYLLPLWTLCISVRLRHDAGFTSTRQAELLGITPADDVRLSGRSAAALS
ncbi:MAG: sodium:proton antiporter [Atopobiaceae bacterium]|jgi:NhaC family Na+:H+ antiporter|nr:sodium:proton antiporter [Atopobiaceae bacterium]MCH4119086.1 sodium:proton antiporter [Atopobiaceae bacterium]MCI1388656.1 sodium:proton antiporter [Atopobiaceae bacterium]MCI1432155.1 sodium:proton antiporter [Atopobiaceae bacterium]MCI1470613.1 sodium:proton antiporter [Atopobiaceae bacterium]